jgi:adenylate cyclase
MTALPKRRVFQDVPFASALLLAAAVAGAVLALRGAGALEAPELAVYDIFVRMRAGGGHPAPQILVVAVTENDIRGLGGWPVSDEVLAKVIERLNQSGARAIGLDIYRDIPVPPGTEQLHKVLSASDDVIAVTMLGDTPARRIDPPPPLRGSERVGFNDVLLDPGGIVRRGLLFMDDATSSYPSLALRLADLYLAPLGIAIEPDPANPEGLRLGSVAIRPLESYDGPYAGTDARGYQFLLDFKGGPRAFETVSLTGVLRGTVPSELVRGRIVLVGVHAESVNDFFFTPLEGGVDRKQHQAGVIVHAHAVDQLLRMALHGEPLLRLPGKVWEALLVLLSALAAALASLWIRRPWQLALVAIAGVGALFVGGYFAFTLSVWLPVVPPSLGWLLSVAAITALLSYRAATEHAALMKLFSRHVAPEVAQVIWEQRKEFLVGGRPQPQHLVVTAFFTDLVDYTPTTGTLAPEDLLEWLNDCMVLAAEEIGRHGGIVRQYAGDAVVAIFGAPAPRTTDAAIAEDAIQAVECALAIQGALVEFNRRARSRSKATAAMRIGIFTGPAIAGVMGSAERAEYVVMGDVVNTAARLESFDKQHLAPSPDAIPCRILIGGTTLAYLGDRYVTEFVGDVLLKGKQEPVAAYHVLAHRTNGPNPHTEEHAHDQKHPLRPVLSDHHGDRVHDALSRTELER